MLSHGQILVGVIVGIIQEPLIDGSRHELQRRLNVLPQTGSVVRHEPQLVTCLSVKTQVLNLKSRCLRYPALRDDRRA